MEAFENLEVWKCSSNLCVELYKSLRGGKDFGFKDQITHAALSVPSNIAEGYEPDSRNEYIRFPKCAKGSRDDLKTQLYIGAEAGFIERRKALQFIDEATQISRMIQGLIKHYGAETIS